MRFPLRRGAVVRLMGNEHDLFDQLGPPRPRQLRAAGSLLFFSADDVLDQACARRRAVGPTGPGVMTATPTPVGYEPTVADALALRVHA